MEELKSQLSALEKNADILGKFLGTYYETQQKMTHGQWEDYMKLSELQSRVLDLKLKITELEQR